MINYHCLDSSLLLPLATHYSIVFFKNMYSLHVELSYYRSKVSIKSEEDSSFQVNPNLKFLIQVPVHFTPCSSTFVPLFYLHCSHKPGVLFGSCSMGADGTAACCIVIVLEPGCSNVITGTPAALYPTAVLLAFMPSCTALCMSLRLDFLRLWLQ